MDVDGRSPDYQVELPAQGHPAFGEIKQCSETFLARFRRARQILASQDPEQIRQLGDDARRAEARAIVAGYPR